MNNSGPDWPTKTWLRQYAVALPTLALALTFKNLAGGAPPGAAVMDGIGWAAASVALFAGLRAWYFHRGTYCSVCGDRPDEPGGEAPQP